MDLAMIGLGRMGGNMARRLMRGGHRVVGYAHSSDAIRQFAAEGGVGAYSLAEAIEQLPTPKIVWIMVPAGAPTDETVSHLLGLLHPGDIIIDGGNSNFRESMHRAELCRAQGLYFVDVGTSGGVWGLTEGYSLMIGGDKAAVEPLSPIFETLAPAKDKGWGHVGPSGSGHFTKMVHNGIEYGMMQAYAEGFEILKAREDFNLDLYQISEIWRYGSVVRSWLLDLAARALSDDPNLSGIKPWVADSGEGRWTAFEAINQDVPAPIITLALLMRFASRQEDSFTFKMLAALRNQFGGHEIRKE
ncbi:MAG: decarboxylating 6-phosphogluconate dehydrogenase [Anaerolineae bacterium]